MRATEDVGEGEGIDSSGSNTARISTIFSPPAPLLPLLPLLV